MTTDPLTMTNDEAVCDAMGWPFVPWTEQDLLDIYDRTQDRPDIRRKVRRMLGTPFVPGVRVDAPATDTQGGQP